ncbi:MAG: MG2 domain-containing protein, partial [Candidatus Aminicenantes bacterium]
MNKESKFFLIILVTILLLFPAACKSKKEQEAVSEVAIPSGELTITYVSPKGRTEAPSEVETIVAIFDHAMVPLEALPEGRGPSVMQLEPSFSGKHRWLNPKTLTFTPDRAFPYSTRITVTIPAGTKTFDGYVLKDDFSWAFQTMRPRIIQHYPQNEQKWIEPDTEILLVFNQPVAKDESFFAFKKTGKDIPEVPLEFALKTPSREMLEENSIESPPENALLIRPKDPLELDSKYAVSIAEGLPGEQGDLGTEKAYAFSFETYTTFQFISLETKDKHNPQDSLKFIFSNPVKYNEFIKQIRLEPEVTIPEYYEEWDHSASTLWVNLPLQPETPYKVWIDTELRDIFGNSLAKQVPLEFQTASYPASLSMPTYHRILEADSELKYPLYVTNTPEILVEAAPVSKKDIIPLLNNPRIFAPGEKFTKKNFFRAREKLQLPIRPNRKDVFPLDLRDYFTEKHGSVFLQLDTFAEQKWSRYPKALLQITNLGLSTKCSPENNLVWVTELRSGQPVPEVAIEIRDDGNRVRWRGKTDKKGWVETPGWKGLGIKSKNEWSPPRQWIFATRGDDFTFINSEWGTGLSPYKFGIPFEWNPQEVEIQGYIFTERGLYRAGETVHIKGIIRKREKGAWKRPAVEQVACEVSDSFNKVLLKQDVGLDSFGSFAIDVETTADASLGTYQIKVDVPSEDDEKKSPLYSSFRIEAFKPAEFEVLLRSRQEEFIFGDDYEADVRASYLFGGAMASQKVSWHLRLEPSSFDPPGYEDFIFGDQIDRWERYGRQESRLLSSGEDVLDRNGQFQIKAKLIPEKEKNSVYASLEATVQGPSRRSISNRIQTLVHKGEFYIGLQPSTTFLPKGKELAVQILTVKPDGQKDAKRKVTLKLIRREWHSVRKAGIGG